MQSQKLKLAELTRFWRSDMNEVQAQERRLILIELLPIYEQLYNNKKVAFYENKDLLTLIIKTKTEIKMIEELLHLGEYDNE